MYSQFTSGLSIKNQIRSSPPHHYCRTLQSSSATTVQHSATGRDQEATESQRDKESQPPGLTAVVYIPYLHHSTEEGDTLQKRPG